MFVHLNDSLTERNSHFLLLSTEIMTRVDSQLSNIMIKVCN